MRMIPLALLLTTVGSLEAQRDMAVTSRPPVDDRAQVLAVMDSVFRAMAARDTALLARQFEAGARLVGVRTRDSTPYMQALTVEQFGRFIAGDQRAAWTEVMREPEVRVDGTLATVWGHYTFHFGPQFSHCGVDAVQLLKLGGRWRIVSLADTYQRAGCPENP